MSEFEERLDIIQRTIEERARKTGTDFGYLALYKGNGVGPLHYGKGYKAEDIIDGMKARGYKLKLTGESETAYEFEINKLPKERYGMTLILQPKSKEDVSAGLTALIKAMERDAKQMPEKVRITVKPSEGLGFGVEFRIEWE